MKPTILPKKSPNIINKSNNKNLPFQYLVSLVYELHEGGLVDVDGVSVPVVQPDHEVEEVGLAKVGRRLLRELDLGDAAPRK